MNGSAIKKKTCSLSVTKQKHHTKGERMEESFSNTLSRNRQSKWRPIFLILPQSHSWNGMKVPILAWHKLRTMDVRVFSLSRHSPQRLQRRLLLPLFIIVSMGCTDFEITIISRHYSILNRAATVHLQVKVSWLTPERVRKHSAHRYRSKCSAWTTIYRYTWVRAVTAGLVTYHHLSFWHSHLLICSFHFQRQLNSMLKLLSESRQ